MRRIFIPPAEKEAYVMTSRFDARTLAENVRYRASSGIACAYSSSTIIDSKFVPLGSKIFMLEMNNDANRIVGIGLIYNDKTPQFQTREIYEKVRYNFFSYIGNCRIDRAEMSEEEEKTMRIMDFLCFSGSRHQKRLRGLTLFPDYLLAAAATMIDLEKNIKNMFRARDADNRG
jgi:hypothetical protein